MESLGNIETSIFNNLREIEKNLILIQEKIRNFEAEKIYNFEAEKNSNFEAEKIYNFEAEKIRNFEAEKIYNFDSGEKKNLITIKNPTKKLNYDINSRETYDVPSDNEVSRIDSILESAKNNRIEKVYKKKDIRRGRRKQTIGFSNYVIDSSSEDE